MIYTFVGVRPNHVASGRPLVFGDLVDHGELTQLESPVGSARRQPRRSTCQSTN